MFEKTLRSIAGPLLVAICLASASTAQAPSIPCSGQKVGAGAARPAAEFGKAVDIEDDLAVIGAETSGFDGIACGAAFVYEHVGEAWELAALLRASDGAQTNKFGGSVSISGTRVVVGAHMATHGGVTAAGAAYVFENQGDDWIEVAKLVASDAQFTDFFGIAVAVDGDTIVVGAKEEDQAGFNAGAAYVFERVGGIWTQMQKLVPADLAQSDLLGSACCVAGNRIVLGVSGSNALGTDSGAAYVYERDQGVWQERAKLVAPDGESSDHFGQSVAVFGDRIAIGAHGEDDPVSNSGAVYLFDLQEGAWSCSQKLEAPDPESNMRFGISVSIEGVHLLAGAYADDDGVLNSGSSYLFRDDGWGYTFARKLRASDAAISDFYGKAVALSGSTVLIGAYTDDDGCHDPTIPDCNSGSAWFHELDDFWRAYCFGETCPCGNDDPVRGCAGSTGFGAALVACGSASVALDDLAFGASGMAADQPTMLFRARDALNAGDGYSFGDGLRCAGVEVKRLGVRYADPAGGAGWGPGLATLGEWNAGDTFHFQVLYRDLVASPCGALFNTTHALEVIFAP